ncbi:MAG: MATE family efflux transporter [Muribaculaceae bacterium]|nr:MATE family efflux transporter [Muribaculaceae bacterium]
MNSSAFTTTRLWLMTGALGGPAIVSNVTVPLLGLCDTYITGHLGNERFIAAIAVGTMMVNALYWLCGFLRMGTTGLTAEAFGRGDGARRRTVLTVGVSLGVLIGLLLMAFAWPLARVMLGVMEPPAATAALAEEYFRLSVLGAPALLATMAVTGWMVGSQNTFRPMVVAISTNVVNIAASLFFVKVAGMGFRGVACGTLLANWVGFGLALLLALPMREAGHALFCRLSLKNGDLQLRRYFRVNGSLFVRSACLMVVSFALTGYASRLGDNVLAVNAVMMQFFFFFSYFMDGFAFGGEALCGRFYGASDRESLRRAVGALGWWTLIVMVVFSLFYLLFAREVAALLTDQTVVVEGVRHLAWVAALLPIVSAAAFMLDGVYVGLTSTWMMMVATMTGAAGFFITRSLLRMVVEQLASPEWLTPAAALWIAFMVFLFLRGAVLGVALPSRIRGVAESPADAVV